MVRFLLLFNTQEGLDQRVGCYPAREAKHRKAGNLGCGLGSWGKGVNDRLGNNGSVWEPPPRADDDNANEMLSRRLSAWDENDLPGR